jgi:hypothetical protein
MLRVALAAAVARAAAAPAPSSSSPSPLSPPSPLSACVLYIPSSLVGFGFGSVLSDGSVSPLWSTKNAWSGILGGALSARGPLASGEFVALPTLADGSSPLASLRLHPATVSYAPLAPTPGHESLGPSGAIAFVNDAARGRVIALTTPDDGSFSFFALTSITNVTVNPTPVPLALLRDVTADLASVGGQLTYGAAAHDPVTNTLFLTLLQGPDAGGVQTSVVAAFPLADATAPPAVYRLPLGYAAESLEWSSVEAAGGARPGLVVLAQNGTGDGGPGTSLAWLSLDDAAKQPGTWTNLYAFAPGVSAPETGVGAASQDGRTLMALVVDPTGTKLNVSLVDVASRSQRETVAFQDPGLIAIDIVECAAAAAE